MLTYSIAERRRNELVSVKSIFEVEEEICNHQNNNPNLIVDHFESRRQFYTPIIFPAIKYHLLLCVCACKKYECNFIIFQHTVKRCSDVMKPYKRIL